jgi:hypothetical protein
MYDKLWLQPLAILIIAVGCAYRLCSGSSVQRRAITSCLVVILAAEMTSNMPRAIDDHVRQTAHLDQARDFAGIAGPNDSVVLDFDDVSSLWLAFWGHNAKYLLLPASKKETARIWLANAERDTAEHEGAIFFVSALDQSRNTLDAFWGPHVGIRYEILDKYRRCATIVRTYPGAVGNATIRKINMQLPSTQPLN